MVDKTDKFKPRVKRSQGTFSPAPSPPPLWFGLVVGGFIGVILTTSLAVGMYWMGFLEVNVEALLPTVDPLVSQLETPDAAAAGTATDTPFSVIITAEATEALETATPSPTMDFNATATAACGVFMEEFPGTPCPSPISP